MHLELPLICLVVFGSLVACYWTYKHHQSLEAERELRSCEEQ